MSGLYPEWTAIIPARQGSKGLVGKNIRNFGGKPLYQHSVDCALNAGAARVVITTDIPAILETEPQMPVEVLARPPQLAADATIMDSVIDHAIVKSRIDGIVVLLQPTSPLRNVADVKNAIRLFHESDFDLVISACEEDNTCLKWGKLNGNKFVALDGEDAQFENRQNLSKVVRPTGAFYVFSSAAFLDKKRIPRARIGCFLVNKDESFDIDNEVQFNLSEAYYRKKKI